MGEEAAKRLANKILEFQIQWGQLQKSVSNQVFNINGKGNTGLTMQQFILLMFLHKMEINTVSQIANFLNLSKSSLSLTLSKMEQEQLIKKVPAADDGRKVYLCATQKGIFALEEREQSILQFFTLFCENLTKEQREDLETGLEKLSRVFKETTR